MNSSFDIPELLSPQQPPPVGSLTLLTPFLVYPMYPIHLTFKSGEKKICLRSHHKHPLILSFVLFFYFRHWHVNQLYRFFISSYFLAKRLRTGQKLLRVRTGDMWQPKVSTCDVKPQFPSSCGYCEHITNSGRCVCWHTLKNSLTFFYFFQKRLRLQLHTKENRLP